MLWVLLGVTLYVIGRGHILPSQRTITIERAGKYRLIMEPELNLAQSYMETAAQRLVDLTLVPTQLPFATTIYDKSVATKKHPHYFLHISFAEELLTLEASRSNALRTKDSSASPSIQEALESIARSRGIEFLDIC